MRSWAAVASTAARQGPPADASQRQAQQAVERREPHPAGAAAPAAAARSGPLSTEELLREAAKSRPDVKGERRCLACGRAFRGDIQRFLQHLKDAHGGRNAAPGSAAAGMAAVGGNGAGAGAAGRTPGLRSVLQLGDVLLRTAPGPRAAPRQQQQRRQQQQPWQPSQQVQHRGLPSKPSLPAPAQAPAAGAAAAVAPPPGTRQRSRRKRESRLKRAFRRSSAVQACSRWQSVLAELEAALQAVGEAAGALANQQAALELQLATAQQQQAQQAQQQAPAAGGPTALGTPAVEPVQGQRALLLANLRVQQQLLEEQQRQAAECVPKLQAAYGRARSQLAAAQRELQQLEKLPVPPAEQQGPGGGGRSREAAGSSDQGRQAEQQQAQQLLAPALPAAPEPEPPQGVAEAAPQSVQQQQDLQQHAAPSPTQPDKQPPATTYARDAVYGSSGFASDGESSAAAASETASSSLASFAFQDVLSGWAAASAKQLPAAAQPAALAAAKTKPMAAAPATNQQLGVTCVPAALPSSVQATPTPIPEAQAVPAAHQQPGGVAETTTTTTTSGGGEGGSSSSNSSGSSSGASFGLQWGDQLLTWASAVRTEAAAVVAQTAWTPQAATTAPAVQAQQQQQQQQEAQPATLPAAVEAQAQAQASHVQPQQPALVVTHSDLAPAAEQQQQPPAAAGIAGAAGLAVASQRSTAGSALSIHDSVGAAPVVDVAAWLASSAGPAAPAQPAGPAAPARPAGPAVPAGPAGPPPGLAAPQQAAVSQQAARRPPPLQPEAPPFLPSAAAQASGPLPPLLQQQQQQEPQAELAGASPRYVQPTAGAPGAFHCSLCGVTISGQRNLLEHLASKRHSKRVAAAAAAGGAAAAGSEAQQALQMAGPVPRTAGAAAHGGQARQAGGAAAAGNGGSKTYVGLGADVGPYVDQIITPELNATAEALLRRLLEWQERVRQTDPANFKRKRRLVSGLREVEKAVKTRRAKLVLLAPNIASIEEPEDAPLAAADADAEGTAGEAQGGTDASEAAAAAAGSHGASGGSGGAQSPAAALVALAREREVPLVFALSRQRMGKVLGQRKRASAFAVLDANGVFEELRSLLAMAEEGRRQWAQRAQQGQQA